MRSFDLVFWLIFLGVYSAISLGSFVSLKYLFPTQHKRKFSLLFCVISSVIIFLTIGLYIWPGDIRSSDNYKFYSLMNGILFSDVILRTTLTLFHLISLPFGKNKIIIRYMGAILSFGLGLNLTHGMFFGKKHTTLKSVNLNFDDLPPSFQGYKILHISDIHLGNSFSPGIIGEIQSVIQDSNPDILVFTGDLVNNYAAETTGWSKAFSRITTGLDSYSILGNHDYGNYSRWPTPEQKAENFRDIVRAHGEFGFKLLRNESIPLIAQNDTIFLVGFENWGHKPFPQYADLEKALEGISAKSFKIVLSHDPAHWEEELKKRPDAKLTLSGHTHGLQWGIKISGIPFSLSFLTRENWSGLYQHEGSYLYVNPGIGTIGIPWRIDMPAEISLIRLQSN